MTYVKIGDREIVATINGKVSDREWDGRESKAITCEMSHDDAVNTFVDGAAWSIIHQADSYVEYPESYEDENGEIITPEPVTITPDPVEYDNSEYSIAGPVTDYRNGTVTIKMGKPTEVETLEAENAALLFESLTGEEFE